MEEDSTLDRGSMKNKRDIAYSWSCHLVRGIALSLSKGTQLLFMIAFAYLQNLDYQMFEFWLCQMPIYNRFQQY